MAATERQRCAACLGEGGYWEEPNGKKTWVPCTACGGTGWQ